MYNIVNRVKNANKVVPIYNKPKNVDKSTNTEIIYSQIEIQRYIIQDIDNNINVINICRKYDKLPEYIAFVMLSNKYEINFIEQFTGLNSSQILLSYLKY